MSGADAPAGDRAWWPARSAAITRPSGRSLPVTASHALRRRRESTPAAMSGPAPATFCIWTPHATRALSAPGTRSPAIALSARTSGWIPPLALGYDFCHAIVDDHSRLAYVELHPDERAATVTAFVERALEFFGSHGINARRLMTDNAFSSVKNRSPPKRSSTSLPSPTGPRPTARSSASIRRWRGSGPTDGLSLPPASEPGPATLAPPLQRDQAPQLTWGPAADQPRSQRL